METQNLSRVLSELIARWKNQGHRSELRPLLVATRASCDQRAHPRTVSTGAMGVAHHLVSNRPGQMRRSRGCPFVHSHHYQVRVPRLGERQDPFRRKLETHHALRMAPIRRFGGNQSLQTVAMLRTPTGSRLTLDAPSGSDPSHNLECGISGGEIEHFHRKFTILKPGCNPHVLVFSAIEVEQTTGNAVEPAPETGYGLSGFPGIHAMHLSRAFCRSKKAVSTLSAGRTSWADLVQTRG
jgi:hypothetical protein